MNKLVIDNLKVKIKNTDRIILDGFNLTIKSGEIHVIMGHPDYEVLEGNIYYNDTLLNNLTTDARANLGIFLGMQNPIEIDGVTNADMLRTALHSKNGTNFKLYDFIKDMDKYVKELSMNPDMIHRGVNLGFSGGERKKNEILQMNVLKPSIVLLDEIDSGLDVDSLKIVGDEVYNYFKEYKPAILLVTHYQRLLDYIHPNFVHIVSNGKIVETGDFSLVKKIEDEGYNKYIDKKIESIGTCAVKSVVSHE